MASLWVILKVFGAWPGYAKDRAGYKSWIFPFITILIFFAFGVKFQTQHESAS
jgi:hypothetical protein